MVSNPHFYGQSTTGTPSQIEDGVDFPHTGIIKALADGLGQNYAISGFDITFDSATQIDVALGVIFRDGKRHEIAAVPNLALGRTDASENSYHLVVVDKDNAIAIRSPSAKDKVANYTVRTLTSGTSTAHKQGDTIVAVVTHNGSNPAPVQYLTVDKAENSLSIGYSNNGTYAEGLTIDTDAGDTTIENKVADKDIIFKVNDATAGSVVDRLILYGDNDSSYPNTEVKIEGSLLVTEDVTTNKLSIGYGNSPSTGVAQISSYSATEDIAFTTGSGSPERLRIKAADGKVGIGTTTPSSSLEIQDGLTTTGAVLTLSTKEPSVVANDVLGQINFQAPLDTGADSDLVGASIQALATATFSDTVNATDLILKTGASETATEKMRITSAGNVGIGTNAPSNPLHVVGNTLIGEITGTYGTAPRNLNLVGPTAVMRVARTHATNAPAIELLQLSANGNTMESYWDIFTDADTLRFRTRIQGSAPSQSTNDVTVLTIKESNQNIGIGTTTPLNCLQINHLGNDEDNGIMIVRADGSTTDGDLLGGIGFDSTDGNVPSSVLEASAFIASIATEDHGTGDKGGNLKLGVSLIDENDDTVSTIVANVGQPDTIANATTHAGLNSRATTAVVAANTYAPTVGDSGTLVIFTHANSNLTLPSVNNTTSVGVQFTVFNETGSTISAQIAVSNSATINGGAASALDDIETYKAATFICSGNNTWIRIG